MARFYGSMQGRGKAVTRTGTPVSGLSAHIRCWNVGVVVCLSVGPDGEDMIVVNRTGGSNSPSSLTGPEDVWEVTV